MGNKRKRYPGIDPDDTLLRRVGRLALRIVPAAAVGAILAVLFFNHVVMPRFVSHGNEVEVPNVVGFEIDVARAHLADHGIGVVADRPGVGRNLQDHLELYVQIAAKQPVTLYKYWNIFGKALIGVQWMLTHKGLGASNQFESAAFIRSRAGIPYPDLQFHFLPIAVRYDGKTALKGHGFQAHVGPMRSPSRGSVSLRSADPKAPPRIFFNYMSHPEDWRDFRTAIRLTREIFAQEAFAPFVSHEIQPGAKMESDAALDAAIRDHAESAYHPCGTCRMGRADDPGDDPRW